VNENSARPSVDGIHAGHGATFWGCHGRHILQHRPRAGQPPRESRHGRGRFTGYRERRRAGSVCCDERVAVGEWREIDYTPARLPSKSEFQSRAKRGWFRHSARAPPMCSGRKHTTTVARGRQTIDATEADRRPRGGEMGQPHFAEPGPAAGVAASMRGRSWRRFFPRFFFWCSPALRAEIVPPGEPHRTWTRGAGQTQKPSRASSADTRQNAPDAGKKVVTQFGFATRAKINSPPGPTPTTFLWPPAPEEKL